MVTSESSAAAATSASRTASYMDGEVQARPMLVITCPICQRRELIGKRQLGAIRNTATGPQGRVRCNADHHLLHDFRRGVTTAVHP